MAFFSVTWNVVYLQSAFGGTKMVRWIRVILLIGCLVAQMHAQAPKGQGSAGPTPAAEPATGQTAAAVPPAKTEFPLDKFTDFSAVMAGSRMEMGQGTAEAHIYRSGKLMRMEGPEGHGYLVTDLSTLETYGVSAGPCMHDTHPYYRVAPFAAARPGTTVERVAVGKEMLDGHSCQIEDITISSQKPGAPPFKMKLWEADDLQGFPIKIEFPLPAGKNATIRYKNVVLGPQDPSLFIHPKSCGSIPQPKSKTPTAAPATKKPLAPPAPR
jgi:hypothetical protein